MKSTVWFSLAVLLSVCGKANAAPINLVTNGSFEQGTLGIGSFQGWQTSLGDTSTFVDSSGQTGSKYGQASNGLWAAYFGTTAADGGSSIAETLATAAGQSYVLSFDLANNNGGLSAINSFLVSLGNTTAFSFINAANQNFIHYQFAFVGATTATQLKFTGSNDNSYFELDNVALTAVPEPSSVALFSLGALTAGFAFRERITFRKRIKGQADRLLS